MISLDGHKDKITLRLEADDSIDREKLSEDIVKRCKEVFKLRMDDVEFLPKGILPEGCEKLVEARWE